MRFPINMALTVGTLAPNFTLASTSQGSLSLRKDLKNRPCILYFYPKDFTSGCKTEACEFRDHFEVFKKINLPVFGISTDSLETHLKFKNKYNLPFDLLSDPDASVTKQYDALIPVINLPKRVTYLLDDRHVIQAVYKKMFGVRNHIKTMIKKASINNSLDNSSSIIQQY